MPRFRPLLETALALALAAALAGTCRAQNGIPPPAFSTDGIAPVYSPPPIQEPSLRPDGEPPNVVRPLPPVDPAVPSPGVGARSGDNVGFGDFGGGGGMGGGGGGMFPAPSFRYGAIWFPNAPVRGQATEFQILGEDFSFTHPLWIDPPSMLALSAGVRNRLIQTDAILPDTGQPYPSDLWDVHLGLNYARQLGNGWMAGGGVNVGSASDHPFASIHEMNVGMNAMLRVPQGEHNAWLFSLMYSPTSELSFPLPGVAFSYDPSPEFHANIGLPFMISWRPTEQWQFQASYMLIHTIHLKALYRFTDRLGAYIAYDWSNEAYMLVDRPEDKDRFFMYDQRASMGLQLLLAPNWTASVAAGYVFDRYSFEGKSFASSGFDRVDIGDGPFAALNLAVRY